MYLSAFTNRVVHCHALQTTTSYKRTWYILPWEEENVHYAIQQNLSPPFLCNAASWAVSTIMYKTHMNNNESGRRAGGAIDLLQ